MIPAEPCYAAMSGHSPQIRHRALSQAAVICRPVSSTGLSSGGRYASRPSSVNSCMAMMRQTSTDMRPRMSVFMMSNPRLLAADMRRPSGVKTGKACHSTGARKARRWMDFACVAGRSEHSRFPRSCWFSRSVSALADAVKPGLRPA